MPNKLYSILARQTDSDWSKALDRISPSIHPVDRRATRIWFAFFPVKLHRALSGSPDQEETAKQLLLKGKYRLSDQVDSSAEFLYGYRYWPEVKQEVAEYAMAAGSDGDLPGRILEFAQHLAKKKKVDASHLTGISAVAFGTLQQVGPEIFTRPAQSGSYGMHWKKSPDQIMVERANDDSQGFFGFLKTVDKKFSVNFREYEHGCRFKILNMQDVTMAATNDKRDHQIRDKRCMPGEGPIPVECRTSSCGTCWVGVLSPTEKISPPGEREIGRWTYFGYEGFTGESDSPIRLACQIKAYGNVTIVIPPWNGMIGKLNE
jgi:ferredoxin